MLSRTRSNIKRRCWRILRTLPHGSDFVDFCQALHNNNLVWISTWLSTGSSI